MRRLWGAGLVLGLVLAEPLPNAALAAESAPRPGGYVFWRKPTVSPEPPAAPATPAGGEPVPAGEPDAAEAPHRVGPAPPAVAPAPADDEVAAEIAADNARLVAQVRALERALAETQADVTRLQAKLQAILTVPQPEDTTKPRVYRVQEGDTLYTIAQRPDIYSDGRLWKRIHEANRHALADPAQLQPGQQLIIPR